MSVRSGHDRIAVDGGQSTLPADGGADRIPEPSRRSLLKGGMLGLAGIVGWTAAAVTSRQPANGVTTAGAAAAATAGATGALKLGGSGFAFGEDDSGAFTTHGDLLGPTGASLGSFTAAPLGGAGEDPDARAQFQTFNLNEGSIFGIGAASPGGEFPATFAIIGGTGEYSGAAGSYLADLRPVDAGGDGSAQFDFTFTQLRGRDGKL